MEVRYSKTARQALLRSNKRQLIQQKITRLAEDFEASANNVTQLRGRDDWRLRVQDWRVIFTIEDDVIFIRDVAPRGSAYEVTG